MASFQAMYALSRRNDDPSGASRPLDRASDGFVCSEGAAVLVLEPLEHALARDARIYAEVTGYGASSDAHHPVQPAPQGRGARLVCALACHCGEVPPTINVDDQDPQCAIDVVPLQARRRAVRHSLSNSFGFGGCNVSLAFSRCEV